MKCFIGLGSNSELAHERINQALNGLQQHPKCELLSRSSLYLTPALLPPGAPSSWNRAFLNAVCTIEWKGEDALELLNSLKLIEEKLGRDPGRRRWAPREIDLDLLFFGEQTISTEVLKVPHPELANRSFVLDPLCELDSSLQIAQAQVSALSQRRTLSTRSPSFMSVINVTPDSFSNAEREGSLEEVENEIQSAIDSGVHWIDIGAESTRPHATVVSLENEWKRLEPVLQKMNEMRRTHQLFPKISIDTYKPEIAQRALQYGVDAINDVTGGNDRDMINLIRQSKCDYICMHSLSVPTRTDLVIAEEKDPVAEVLSWAKKRVGYFKELGINLNRIILDPGIGFNKTGSQSLALMQRIEEFYDLPVRILVGHSRKSFMEVFTKVSAPDRDFESIGLSMHLGLKGVEIIRVHKAHQHQRAWNACQHLHPQ